MTLQLAVVAGVAVMQLVEGRAAGPGHRASEVIAPHELDFAGALNNTLEGKTDKLKNPHQEASLAWTVAGSAAGAVTSVTAPPPLKPSPTNGINSKP